MAVGGFTQLLSALEQADFFIGVLPFLLTYLVFYMVLQEVPVIGDDDKVPPLMAIIFGFFVSYFLVQNPAYQAFFVNYLGTLTVGLLGILGLFTVVALSGVGDYFEENWYLGIVGVIIIAIAFTVSGGINALFLGQQEGLMATIVGTLNYTLNTGLIWVALILGVLWFSMGSGGSKEKAPLLKRIFTEGKSDGE